MKRKLTMILLAVTVIASAFGLTACGEDEPPMPEVKTVYLLKDGVFDYGIVYSNDKIGHYDMATEIFSSVIIEYGLEAPDRYNYTNTDLAPKDKEIVIGDTDRQISKDLKAAIAEKENGNGGVWWAYGYKDGKLGFYANSSEAADLGWDTFLEIIMKDKTIECADDLWAVNGMTATEYEAYLQQIEDEKNAAIEAERKEKIAYIRERIAAITASSLSGTMPSFVNASGEPFYGYTTITTDKLYSHPRIWVNSETLPDVIANLHVAENETMYLKMEQTADLEYTGRLGSEMFGSSGMTGNRNFTVQDSAKIEALAFMYLVTGDELYGYSAIRAAKNFLDSLRVRPNKSTWTGDQIYDISNQSGTAMGVMAEVYDWCYPLLHEKDKEYIVKATLTKLACNLEVDNPPKNSGCVSGHSTASTTLRDWPSFAIAVADEYPEIYNHMISLIEYYYAPAPNWYYPSGANFQGSAYGVNKTYLHMISEMLVKMATGEKIYADDVSFEATVYTYISYLRPDGESLRIGDDYNQLSNYNYNLDKRMEVYGSLYYKDPKMKSWAMALTNNFADIGYGGLLETTPTKILLFNDPNLEYDTDTRFDMPLINYNGSPTGALIARNAWGDPDAWMVYMNIDESYGANHDHKDAGTFQIYYKGILAPNTGAYQHYANQYNQAYGSLYDFAYVKQTVSKNGLLIYNPNMSSNGNWTYSGGQTVQSGTTGENATLDNWLAKTTSHQATELAHSWGYDKSGALTHAYISGDITLAYDQETVDLVMRSMIAIATGNEAHPLMYVVYDRIASDDPSYKKSYLLHTMEDPTFTGDFIATPDSNESGIRYVEGTNVFYYTNTKGASGQFASDNPEDKYNGKLTHTTLLPEDPVFTVIGGDGYRFWVSGKQVGTEGSLSEKHVTELGWGRVEISPSKESLVDSFLNVMYVGDADKDDTYVPATLIKSDTHEGAVSFGKCVMFSKTARTVGDEFSFTTSGEGTYEYYVSGLHEGKWSIALNGEKLTDVTVDETSGMAIFEAESGEITFTPAFAVVNYETGKGKFNDGVQIPTVATVGEAFTLPTDISLYGSSFEGWYTSADFSGSPVTEITPDSIGTVTLYAKWKRLFGVIKYELDGGEILGEYTDKNYEGTRITLPTEVVRNDDRFLGWYTDKKFTNSITEIPAESDEDLTLYAKFKVVGAYWSLGKGSSKSQYYFGYVDGGWSGGDIGSAMMSADSTRLTLRIDLASTGNENWTDGSIRLRQGLGGHECHFLKFEDGNMVTGIEKTVLTPENSGAVIDAVIDFKNQDIYFYVDGELKATEHHNTIGTDLNYYNYETSPEPGKILVRGNLFQLTNTNEVGRTLAYDNISIFITDVYSEE